MPIEAKSLSIGYCQHGVFTIYFHDEAGNIVATGSMPVQNAIAVVEDFTGKIQAYLQGEGAVSGKPCGSVH